MPDYDISKSILNSILGFCLYQRKLFVLHSSAVEYRNNAILFIGMSGAGKSSLSASLCSGNTKFITEDVACLERHKNKFYVRAGPPLVKLDKKVALDLDHLGEGISLLNDRFNRKLYELNNSTKKLMKIKKCYVLEWGEDFSINEMDSKSLLANFLACSYSAYPFNTCPESSRILMKSISQFTNSQEIFVIKRSKKNYFRDNDKILEHINS